MNEKITGLEVYLVRLDQDRPYLGNLQQGEVINSRGYFVRIKNRTVYSTFNQSIIVKIWTDSGVIGWGETYGLIAPQATASIILDLFKEFVVGRNPFEVEHIYDFLYDLMRVRGYTGGFYHDALAAVDIALWDILGKLVEKPLSMVLGGLSNKQIPAYISGLPGPSIEERCQLAITCKERGFKAFKFALPAADQGPVAEIEAFRNVLGDEVKIACDMHWRRTRLEAIELGRGMTPYNPWFLEAPVLPEDLDGLYEMSQKVDRPIAVGEEWRTVFDAKLRIDRQACQIIQPEMGHTGVTQFLRICKYAQAHHIPVIPHATIGAGIFLAASLQLSATLENVVFHEYQHTIFDDFLHFTTGEMKCTQGAYQLPTGNGIGVEPTPEMKSEMTRCE